MKKIGTLTFHRAYNYGAVLQAYALQRVLIDGSFDTSVIDYRNPQIEEWFHWMSAKGIIKYCYEFLFYHSILKAKKEKGKKFDSFLHDKIRVSEKVNSIESVKDTYDAIITGSDQIWNLDMTRQDENYFLPYQNGAEKISYAASFGTSELKPEYRERVKTYLSSFRTLTVREETGVNIICGLLPTRTVKKVVDPSFLLSREEWRSIERAYEGVKPGSYVLMYFVAPQTNSIQFAERIAKERNLKILWISTSKKKLEGINKLADVGPEEFLWLIDHASLVVTTSYHGMILSINLNTPFMFELNSQKENKNSRLMEIRDRLQLQDYQIKSSDPSSLDLDRYDWDRINGEIDLMRKESREILFEQLV